MRWIVLLSLVFVVTNGVAGTEDAVVEIERSLPELREIVLVHYRAGLEQVLTNSNHFMLGRPEVGLFERRSANLFSRIKAMAGAAEGGAAVTGVIPHRWQVRLFGRPIASGSTRIEKAVAAVQAELNKSDSWVGVDTVRVVVKNENVILTYKKRGKATRTEVAPLLDLCRNVQGKYGCQTKYGIVFVKRL